MFDRPNHFRDSLVRGAFSRFDHGHFFHLEDRGTIMRDVFDYVSPFGWLGRSADALFLRSYMSSLLERRAKIIKLAAEATATDIDVLKFPISPCVYQPQPSEPTPISTSSRDPPTRNLVCASVYCSGENGHASNLLHPAYPRHCGMKAQAIRQNLATAYTVLKCSAKPDSRSAKRADGP